VEIRREVFVAGSGSCAVGSCIIGSMEQRAYVYNRAFNW
jgi:hypothetical protein